MKRIDAANLTLAVLFIGLLICCAGPQPAIEAPPRQGTEESPPAAKKETPPPAKPNPQENAFPRRLLAISVCNYMYANSIQYGSMTVTQDASRRDVFATLERLANGWRIPKCQRYFVADGATRDGKIDLEHPPIKLVVNGTIDSFLSTSRAQDRIVLVFAGHAIEKDGDAYLVPLDGEFDDLKSLIPLKDLYARLGKCKAQEKFVIFDVCRHFPGKNIDRPTFGMMTPGLEKALHDCPDGVTVWTSCSAGQYSYEDEYAELSLLGLGKLLIEGSYFFSMFTAGHVRVNLFNRRQNSVGIAHPSDPLPIGPVTAYVNEKIQALAKEFPNQPQTPKVTSRARKEWIPYDAAEALAESFALTQPPVLAKPEEVVAIFREIGLRPIRGFLIQTSDPSLAERYPFTATEVKDYLNGNGPTFDDLVKMPVRFAKEFPLRSASVEAIERINSLKADGVPFPLTFSSPITRAELDRLMQVEKLLAVWLGELQEVKERLAEAGKRRDRESSKRWQAHFEYLVAQTMLRLAYLGEYEWALNQVKLGKLPQLDPKKHRGWSLTIVEQPCGPQPIRDLTDDGRKALAKLALEHPHTPWAVLAKNQRCLTLGLQWEPLLKDGAQP